jgi:hypothetical protein
MKWLVSVVLAAPAVIEPGGWSMPWGVFNAEVEGLGAAFDQLKAC